MTQRRTSGAAQGLPSKRALLVGAFVSSVHHVHSVGEDLAERLAGTGWEVTLTSRCRTRGGRLADMLATSWRRRNRYSVAQVDVYSGRAFAWAEAVCFALRRAGRPYVLTLHGGNLPSFSAASPRRVAGLLRTAAAVTAPSGFLKEKMLPYRPDLHLVPNPIDLERYRFRRRERPARRLIWLRAFHEVYNPALAVEVVARLIPRFPDLRLEMVGPDKDGSLQRTQRAARRAGVADHITFRGGVPNDQVPRCLHEADVFINTTDVDNTPVSVIEAMASGLCVVSTDAGGLPYLLDNEENALLVPRRDAEAMAAAIGRVLEEANLAGRLSVNARRKVEAFDWSRVLPAWEQLLLDAQRNINPV